MSSSTTTPPRAPAPALASRSPAPVGRYVAPAAVLAVTAAILGLLVSGGAARPRIADPGAVVRWGLPLTNALAWIVSASALGLLVMAAFIIPERTDTDRRTVAIRLAGTFALLWSVLVVVRIVLVFADIAGLPLTDPQVYVQLTAFVFTLEVTRVLAIIAAIALFVGVYALFTRSRAITAWLAALTIVGIFLPALNAHAGGTVSHEDAVNSLAAHRGAVGLWLGGLIALLLLRPLLGKDLPVSVRRFSTLATWAYAVVALSGIQQAIIRIGSLDGIATGYGALVLVKALAFVALGWFGWQQRRLIAEKLETNPQGGALFARLAATEVSIMALAAGLGVALGRTAPPAPEAAPERSMLQVLSGYPDPGPMVGSDWITAWRINWLFLAVGLLAMGLYAAGVIRLHRRGDRWPPLRTALWMAGWLLWIHLTSGAPEIWGRVLFSTHMIMHMGVAMTVPLFLVPAAPLTLALRALPARKDKTWGPREVLLHMVHSRVSATMANPVIAATFFFVSMAIFYWTPLFELALTTHTGHILMMGHFFLTGYLFVWVLAGVDPGPPRWPPLALLVILFITVSFHAFFGVSLTGSEKLLAPGFFGQISLPWMTNPLEDQHRAGMIAWGVGEAPTLILAVMVALQWFRSETRLAERVDRQADRDGDADLTAYNAWLTRLREEGKEVD